MDMTEGEGRDDNGWDRCTDATDRPSLAEAVVAAPPSVRRAEEHGVHAAGFAVDRAHPDAVAAEDGAVGQLVTGSHFCHCRRSSRDSQGQQSCRPYKLTYFYHCFTPVYLNFNKI